VKGGSVAITAALAVPSGAAVGPPTMVVLAGLNAVEVGGWTSIPNDSLLVGAWVRIDAGVCVAVAPVVAVGGGV